MTRSRDDSFGLRKNEDEFIWKGKILVKNDGREWNRVDCKSK